MLAPNVPAKPDTVMFNKVTIKGAGQAVQMFGPAQAAVAKAVVDSVADGTIPKAQRQRPLRDRGRVHPLAGADNKKIYDYNYRATKESITRAMKDQPIDGRGPLPEGHGQAPVRVDAASSPCRTSRPHRELAGVQAAPAEDLRGLPARRRPVGALR